MGGSGDTLNRVEEYLNERRDKAAGRRLVVQKGGFAKEFTGTGHTQALGVIANQSKIGTQ